MWFQRFFLMTACGVTGTVLANDPALIRIGDTWRYLKGDAKASAPGANWSRPDFDDSTWPSGPSGLVLPEDEDFSALTNRPAGRVRLFVRKRFAVAKPAQIKWLVLRVEHEEGFVAYLNGVEIARHQGVGVVLRNADGEGEHYVSPVSVDVSQFRSWLRQGENVLALEGTHSSLSDSEFSLAVALLANFSRGPFVQNASTNGIQVIWRTPSPASTFVEYGVTDALGTVITNEVLVTNHVVTLTDLSPGTPYYYRVGSDDGAGSLVSDVEMFRTLKTSGPIRFVVFGDSGQGTVAQGNIADVIRAANPDIVLHSGDVIYGGFRDPNVDTRFFNYYQRHMKNTPYYLSIGNHDLNCCAGDGTPDWNPTNWVLNTTNYQEAFYLPTNSATGTEHFYSFDHGDAHFVALYNPYYYNYVFTNGSDQYLWLTNDLARSTKPWKFLFFHLPIADSGRYFLNDNDNNSVLDRVELMDLLSPLADRYGVNLVFSGHEHNYERFAPTNNLHYLVTGGGGASLYSFTQRHSASAQFLAVAHCVEATLNGDTLTLRALNAVGAVFDTMIIHRALAASQEYASTWNTPVIETASADNGDGNITGQTFDLVGAPIAARTGQFSNLGEFYVNNDAANLYVGIRHAMFYANNNIFLFLESPRLTGVSSMSGLGNAILDPTGEGADGLDCLENLSFTNFTPAIGCILGDEYADGTTNSFSRPGLGFDVGQGIFQLGPGLSAVVGARLQQFNRSPESGAAPGEQNADLIEIAIPFAALGNARPGDVIKIGAVVGGYEFDTFDQTRQLDTGVLGTFLSGSGQGPVVLGGVRVRLVGDPANPDWDGDGLPNNWEIANGLDPYSAADNDGANGDPDGDGFANEQEFQAGTDALDAASRLKVDIAPLGDRQFRLNWQAIIGKKYQLEYSDNLINFLDVTDAGFPRTAGSTAETYDVTLSPGHSSRFYRIRLVP